MKSTFHKRIVKASYSTVSSIPYFEWPRLLNRGKALIHDNEMPHKVTLVKRLLTDFDWSNIVGFLVCFSDTNLYHFQQSNLCPHTLHFFFLICLHYMYIKKKRTCHNSPVS